MSRRTTNPGRVRPTWAGLAPEATIGVSIYAVPFSQVGPAGYDPYDPAHDDAPPISSDARWNGVNLHGWEKRRAR